MRSLPRELLERAADWLAVAIAVSLPWSTSATGILILLWLVAVVPTLDAASVRREVMTAAGGLPVLLWALGTIGMLWADVSWGERIDGLRGYHKLLTIPLLLAQFRRSGQAKWVVIAFLTSAVVLLIVSWGLVLTPGLSWRGRTVGVPVKNYLIQSEIFAIVAFGLIGQAAGFWRLRHNRRALVLVVLTAAFIANIVFVATGLTTLVAMAALLLLFGLRQFGWKGALGACLIGGITTSALWASSPYLRQRVLTTIEQMRDHDSGEINSVSLRLEYWEKSVEFVAEAPVFGHGTGTIPKLFQRDITEDSNPQIHTTNPHNQILAVTIELGLPGAVALIAMWIAHFILFRDRTVNAWLGLVVVTEHIVSSLFNTPLFDFTNAWLYVVGVGVLGGVTLQTRKADPSQQARFLARPLKQLAQHLWPVHHLLSSSFASGGGKLRQVHGWRQAANAGIDDRVGTAVRAISGR